MKKLNEIQKIALSLYVIILTSICLFYLPVSHYNKENSFETIWSYHGKIDIPRLTIITLILTVIFMVIIKFSESFNLYNENERKKILKKEVKIFLLLIFINLASILFFTVNNGINYLEESKLLNHIESNKKEIDECIAKRKIRREFWDYVSTIFDMREFNNQIDLLWQHMENNIDNEKWLNFTLSKMNNENLIKFKIKYPEEFKMFIRNNTLTEEDFAKEKNNVFLESDIIEKKIEIGQIGYYSPELIRKYMLYIFLCSILFLYIFRIAITKLTIIFKE